MTLSEFSAKTHALLNEEILAILNSARIEGDDSLYQLLSYHMGFDGAKFDPLAAGKRIRPLLVLLVAEAVSDNWEPALPIGASIEVLHNFSLIHDDIEDNSPMRRGRPTVWSRAGIPLAVNAGDAMFSLVFQSLERLPKDLPADTRLSAWQLIAQTCLHLTKGQHLDISFESEPEVSVSTYLEMVSGKTAALISASAQSGALVGLADQETQKHYQKFGKFLGLAFQIQDDILGIWGDDSLTGKSTATDLLARKKSLPVVFGLQQKKKFYDLWQQPITTENVAEVANQLRVEGAFDYARQQAREFSDRSRIALANAKPGKGAAKLEELIDLLLKREL